VIVGVGNDVLEVSRMRRELARPGRGFRDEVFTASEIAYCESKRYPARHFAARFAAKEACLKALRTGADRKWATWREVEVARGPRGEPELVLHGHVKRLAGHRRVRRVLVSLSHTPSVAMASVVLET
jgi:holo-[acyl-carrier protein] synthase